MPTSHGTRTGIPKFDPPVPGRADQLQPSKMPNVLNKSPDGLADVPVGHRVRSEIAVQNRLHCISFDFIESDVASKS